MNIRPLDTEDVGYALRAWQEAHKTSPGCDRAAWWAYKVEYGAMFKRIVNDPTTEMLGAYNTAGQLLGFLVMTRGKRIHTLHWCQVKNKLDGKRVPDRRDIFFALIDEAKLGSSFAYTLRGPRCRKGAGARSLDELLVVALRERGTNATHISLKDWLK